MLTPLFRDMQSNQQQVIGDYFQKMLIRSNTKKSKTESKELQIIPGMSRVVNRREAKLLSKQQLILEKYFKGDMKP
jgi:hypothetical protein